MSPQGNDQIGQPELPNFLKLWNFSDPSSTREAFLSCKADNPEAPASYLLEIDTQIARTYGLEGNFDDAHSLLDQIKPSLGEQTPLVQVRYHLERGRAFNSAKKLAEGREQFLLAWDKAREAKEDGLAVDAAHMMGIATKAEESLSWNEKAMSYAEQSDSPKAKNWLGALYNNNGWTYHEMGEFERALELWQKGLEWRKEKGQPQPLAIAHWTVARGMRSLNRNEEALAIQRQLLSEISKEESKSEHAGYVHEEIAECLLAIGRAEESKAHFTQAYECLKEVQWVEAARKERLKKLGE